MSLLEQKKDFSKRGAFDELYTPEEAVEMILKYIPNEVKTIWECTAIKESKIVKVLKDAGYNVITSHILYRQEAVVIAKALNEGWVPDYTNSNQTKYESWFKYDSSAGGFVYYDCAYWFALTGVGLAFAFIHQNLQNISEHNLLIFIENI